LKYPLPAAIIILQGPFAVSCRKEERQGKKKAS
jgi:lipoprotein